MTTTIHTRHHGAGPAGTDDPVLTKLPLDAGQQFSAPQLLSAQGRIARVDVGLFADTGWEPAAVYRRLDRLTAIAADAGIEVCRVSSVNIRADALDPAHRFASMHLFTLTPDGPHGIARRQCIGKYKVKPLSREVRRLGYPHPHRVPDRANARMCVVVSVEKIVRAGDSDARYMRRAFPLLDLGWRRCDCQRFLATHGLGDTPRSSRVGCPIHTDAFWWQLKHDSPGEWEQAVAIRHGSARANAQRRALRGTSYLHQSRRPLDQVVLRPRAVDVDRPGCGPLGCPYTPAAGEVL